MLRTAITLLVTLAVLFGFQPVLAESLPGSKSAVAMSAIALVKSTTGTEGWTPILRGKLKVAEQKDLAIDVSLECGLYTDTLARSKGGTKDTSAAEAIVKIRVAVFDGANNLVMHAAPGGAKGIVFARRAQELSATFQGLIDGCLSVDENGIVVLNQECLKPEEVELVLDTMNANAFNFLAPNLGAGIHTLVVEAKIDTAAGAQGGTASARAAIGRGSMLVEEIRLVKGSEGSTL